MDSSLSSWKDFRRNLLDSLAIEDDGILFRYIPAGTFLMGSDGGDPDEQPVHPVEIAEYWLSETPVSLAAFARIMGYNLPPQRMLSDDQIEQLQISLHGG